jgi:hypothetical protein
MAARVYALYDRCVFHVPTLFPGLTFRRWKVRLCLQPNHVQADTTPQDPSLPYLFPFHHPNRRNGNNMGLALQIRHVL